MTTNGLVAAPDAVVMTDERINLFSRTYANGAPPLELELFIQVCNRTGLDPFARQIFFIERGGKWTAQTSIDGYRLIAARTGLYAGSDEPVYDTEDADHPNKATVTVWKLVDGQRCPFTASARWSEYRQTGRDGRPMGLWGRMPYLMLAKCAEALALRKAFPQELSGLYTRDEMDQAASADAAYVETTGAIVDRETGEVIDEDEALAIWGPEIEAAQTSADIHEVGVAMRAAGIDSQVHRRLTAIYNRRKVAIATGQVAADDQSQDDER